jgi:hypothetical protein
MHATPSRRIVPQHILGGFERWRRSIRTNQPPSSWRISFVTRPAVDVRAAYSHTLTAAANAGVWDAVRTRIRALFDDPAARSGFVARVIGKEVGLD